MGNRIPLPTSLGALPEESPIPFRFRSSSYRVGTLLPSELQQQKSASASAIDAGHLGELEQ